MSDQRREARKKVMAFTPVYGLRPSILLGYLVDLTAEGARVEGETPVEINKQFELAIEFPGDLPEITIYPFTISAIAVRCGQEEGLQFYSIGFKFTDITPEQARVIEAIIQRYAFHQEPVE